MAKAVNIGGRLVGDGHPCYVVAEIGINHNGNLEIAKRLIDAAVLSGCDAVKFQKRTVDVVYSGEELAKPRENPFGATNGDLKRGLELGEAAYAAIDAYCKERRIAWFASSWDEASVDFIERFNPPCHKVASASLTDDGLLQYQRRTGRPVVISTGMSTIEQIDHAVDVLGRDNLVVMHTTSTYPSDIKDLNLRVLLALAERYGVPVGYSGHEVGLPPSVAAVALGACMVERHITVDRAMWGTDQAASVEPHGIARLVKDIRNIEAALGDGVKRPMPSELDTRAVARRSLVAARALPAGHRLTRDDIAIKRPGTGIPPADVDRLVGRTLGRGLASDELLDWTAVEP
jgi:N-acetylneuraminate synthase